MTDFTVMAVKLNMAINFTPHRYMPCLSDLEYDIIESKIP